MLVGCSALATETAKPQSDQYHYQFWVYFEFFQEE